MQNTPRWYARDMIPSIALLDTFYDNKGEVQTAFERFEHSNRIKDKVLLEVYFYNQMWLPVLTGLFGSMTVVYCFEQLLK